MSVPESLIRHNYGLPILKYLQEENIPVNVSLIMEKLQVSKRSLYLTLKDLETDELITQTKIGRKSIINVTEKGLVALETLGSSSFDNDTSILQSVIESTVKKLEEEGIITKDWTQKERNDFINKLRVSLEKKK